MILREKPFKYTPMGSPCNERAVNVYSVGQVFVSLLTTLGVFVLTQGREGLNGLEVVGWDYLHDTTGCL